VIMLCISGEEVRRWQQWAGSLHLMHAARFEDVADDLLEFHRCPRERYRVGFTNIKSAQHWRLS
jgi:hypothetical protein